MFPHASSTGSSLVYLEDKSTSCWFLVDSGASVSVFPAPPVPFSSGFKLLTADGSFSSAQVPELFLYGLVLIVLTGLFSWLRSPFPSSERIFYAIITYCSTLLIRECSVTPLLVLLSSALPLLRHPLTLMQLSTPAEVHLQPPC